ncbi:Uma2 family endonuclease [Streptomyces flaveolus]|uniref:Uma2 family endonuclease n=1 Tax=Streptomyces flaveolus TaxID=67297 RepID=UPI00342B3E46
MTIAPGNARRGAFHRYRAMRDFVQSADDTLPGKFEITQEGIVHDMTAPVGESQGLMRRPDIMVITMEDMDVPGSFDPRTLIAAIEIVSRSNPDNDWVGKVRDYPLMGVPVYAVFDPRTGTGAVFTDIHPTPAGPRYATRKDFVYGEDVTIADWTISTEGLPLYG